MELIDDGMCFVCGKKNPLGLKLDFNLEGEVVKTRFKPQKEHQGFADIVHGGIIALILDEVIVNLPWRLGIKAVTAEFNVRLKRPVYVGEELEFTSRIVEDQGRLLVIEADAKKTDGSLIALATGKCMKV